MKLVLNNNKQFKQVFEVISNITDEIRIECDTDGLRLRALSRSHIEYVSLDLKSRFFDEYACETPETICLDIMEFNKVLKRCKNEDRLIMGTDDSNLVLTFEGDSTRVFHVRLIDLEYDTPNAPVLELPVTLNIDTSVLVDMLDDAVLFSESARFDVDGDYLYCRGEGGFGDTVSKYVHGERVVDSVGSMFNIGSLKSMLRMSSICDDVSMSLGDDNPLFLTFDIGDGVLEFMLAPRVGDGS